MVTKSIFAHARRAPNRTAIVFNNHALSYRRFAELIGASQRYLTSQGVGGDGIAVLPIFDILAAWVVGLALRSLGMTTIVVGSQDEIGKLGLPGISHVVTTEAEHDAATAATCAASGWRSITVPRAAFASGTAGAAPLLSPSHAARGGHILLTSGTTGIYKKVLIDAAHARAFVDFHKKAFGISRQSVVNVFNLGGWTGAGYRTPTPVWDAGGCVVMYQGQDRHESFRYPGITHAIATPQHLANLLAAPAGALRRDDRMRLFVTAGALPASLAQATKERLTSRVYTYLGTTEASIITLTPIEQDEDLRWHRILPSRTAEIVDEEGHLVPAGQVGLVRVATIGGVAGYLHDEEATHMFFRDGYFYPGDLGVIGPDGRLALHGRVTDVVHVLGLKIPTAPIEEALQHKLGVAGACVLSMQNDSGDEIVHVVIETPRPVAQSAIVAVLGEALPGAYHAKIHFLDALPRNGMGKIQRDALRQRLRLAG